MLTLRLLLPIITILLSVSMAHAKEIDRYSEPMQTVAFFGFTPPWAGNKEIECFRKFPEAPKVTGRSQNPILSSSFVLDKSESGIALKNTFPVFDSIPVSSVHLLPLPSFHGWSFEPVRRPEAPVSNYLLDSNMIAAEFCRQNMNPGAAYAIYQKTAPMLSKNMYGIDYICDLYSELGKISELQPFIRTELEWLSHPMRWPLPAEIANDSERKRDNYKYQKQLSARLRGHLFSKMINGYLRISDYKRASKMDRHAMQLDRRFPQSDTFEYVAYTYFDVGDRKTANQRIAEGIQNRIRRYGTAHEITKQAEQFEKDQER